MKASTNYVAKGKDGNSILPLMPAKIELVSTHATRTTSLPRQACEKSAGRDTTTMPPTDMVSIGG